MVVSNVKLDANLVISLIHPNALACLVHKENISYNIYSSLSRDIHVFFSLRLENK